VAVFFWGLNFVPIKFQKTFQLVDFTPDGSGTLSIFTKDGLQVGVDCAFQFRLIKEQIPTLFSKFGISYYSSVVNLARSILKNIAPGFTTEQYYTQRQIVSDALFAGLKTGLEAEINVEVGAFQLKDIVLSTAVASRLLSTVVQDQVNQREAFVQNATVIRKQTTTLQQSTLSNITVINAQANANASVLIQTANSQALSQVLQAKQTALANLFTTLGIVSSELKLSFLYSTGLGDRTTHTGFQTELFVDLNNVIVNAP